MMMMGSVKGVERSKTTKSDKIFVWKFRIVEYVTDIREVPFYSVCIIENKMPITGAVSAVTGRNPAIYIYI